MKKLTLLILLVFLSSCLNAQINLDSLHNVWEDKTQADSIRVNAYYDYLWDGYLFSQTDSAIGLADGLFSFSKKKEYQKGMALALNIQGIAYYVKGDYTSSLEIHLKSLKIKEIIGDKKSIAGSLNNIGNAYAALGEYSDALAFYKKSLKNYEEIKDQQGISKCLNNIGIIYDDQGNYTKALGFYERSLQNSQIETDKLGISNTLNNIGAIYGEQGDPLKALEYFKRSLKLREEAEYIQGISGSLNNIGSIYSNIGEYLKALEYQTKSLKMSKGIGDKQGEYNALFQIGIIYSKQGKYTQALDFLQRSLIILENIGDKQGIADTLRYIGIIYNNQKDHNLAIENCKKALDMAVKIGSIDLQKVSCECLYDAYKAQRNDKKALTYHEQMLVLIDSLQTKETAKKLQQMEFSKLVLADSLVQVEKDLKVKMAHQTEVQKKDKNRNIALGGGMFFLFLSGGLYSRWRYVKKSKAVIEKEKDRSENLLLNILPSEIAEELKEKGSADARDFEMASILFTDFKGFTQASEKLTAKELIEEINSCFKAFDHICETYGIEKIKTIGDAYMAAGGLPVPSEGSIKNTVLAALEMQSFISNRIIEKDKLNKMSFKMRLGIHTGPVVAGIVGVKKFQYDIWGDTVNTASRMESSGEIGKVNISQGTYAFLKDDPDFTFISRGKINAKGKGEMEMYFVEKKLK